VVIVLRQTQTTDMVNTMLSAKGRMVIRTNSRIARLTMAKAVTA
jgi:hypothetical protein